MLQNIPVVNALAIIADAERHIRSVEHEFDMTPNTDEMFARINGVTITHCVGVTIDEIWINVCGLGNRITVVADLEHNTGYISYTHWGLSPVVYPDSDPFSQDEIPF